MTTKLANGVKQTHFGHVKTHFGVMNKVEPGKPYGVTRYWAEIRDDGEPERVEFTDPNSLPEKFGALREYINSTYVQD